MRLACLTCTLFCLFFSLSAQPPDFELIRKDLEKVDSLIFTLNQEKAYPIIKNLRKQRLSHEAGLLLDVYEARTHFHNRELEKGLKMLRTLKEPVERKGDAYLKGNWLLAKGIYHFRERENDSTLLVLDKAIETLEKSNVGRNDPLVFAFHTLVLTKHWRLASEASALAAALRMDELLSPYSPSSIYRADVWYSLGSIYNSRGDIEKAKTYISQAVVAAKATGWESLVNNGMVVMGNIFYSVSQYSEAIPFYLQAISAEIRMNGVNSHALVDQYVNCGFVYALVQEYDDSYSMLMKAKKLVTKLDGVESEPYSRVIYNLADYFRRTENFDSSMYYYRENLRIRKQIFGVRHLQVGWAHIGLASVCRDLHLYDSALVNVQKAIISNHPTFNSLNPADNPPFTNGDISNSMFHILSWKLKHLVSKWQNDRSESTLFSAMDLYMALEDASFARRQHLDSDISKLYMFEDMRDIFEAGLEIFSTLHMMNPDDEMVLNRFYKILQKSKSVLLIEQAYKSEQRIGRSIPRELWQLNQETRTKLSRLEDVEQSKIFSDSVATLRLQLSRRQDSISTVVKSNYPGYYYLNAFNSEDNILDLKSRLNYQKAAFVEFYWGNNGVYSLYFDGQKFSAKKLESFELLEERVLSVISMLQAISRDKDQFGEHSYWLALHLFDESFLSSLKQCQLLYVIPNGILTSLPFESLITEKPKGGDDYENFKYLILRTPTIYSYTSHFVLNNEPQDFNTTKGLGLGSYVEGLSTSYNLPGSKRELDELRHIMKGKVVYTARKSDLLDNLDQKGILHLAVHGGADTTNFFGSYLQFFGEHLDNSRFYSYELYDKRVAADLVVLSSCESGSGKTLSSEGAFSLGRAFKYSGANMVIQSLWKADDEATGSIMNAFYRELNDNCQPYLALHLAKKQLILAGDSKTAHPGRWAALLFYGEPTIHAHNYSSLFVAALLTAVSGIVLIWILRRRPNQRNMVFRHIR